jgi:hypothetical protein
MPGTVMPNPKFFAVDANGSPYAGGTLTTYAAGGTTPLATFSDVGLATPNANPVVLDAAGRATVFLSPAAYRFVLKDSGGVQIWDQDNINATPPFNVDVDVVALAGVAIAAGEAVYLSDGSGGLTAGRWYLADSDNPYSSIQAVLVGMAPAAIASGALGSVRILGRITGLTGLTAGATYYASATAGAITTTRPVNAMIMGVADYTTTALVLRPRQVADVVLDRDVSTTTQAAAGPTTHYTYSVPGGTLGTLGTLRFRAILDFLNNTGVDRTVRVEVLYGATTIFDSTAVAVTTSASRRGVKVEVDLSANNATNAQVASSRMEIYEPATASGVAVATAALSWTLPAVHNAVAEDSTAAKTLLMRCTLSTTDANLVVRTFTATLELL